MKNAKIALFLLPALALSACAETPMNSNVSMLPPPGKSFETFQQEQYYCRHVAEQSVYGEAEHQNHRAIFGGLGTTLLGAGIGAAAGGGTGAAIGAAAGALGGTLGGGFYSDRQGTPIQKQYDNQYTACMVSKGNVQSGQVAPSIYSNTGYATPAYQQQYQAPSNYYQAPSNMPANYGSQNPFPHY